jgi:hypothetical protein
MSTVIVMLPHNFDAHPAPPGAASPDSCPGPAPWHTLPFHPLKPYEPITHQYYPLGVMFTDTIAICPSNPRFTEAGRQQVLMPASDQRGLGLVLTQPLAQVQLWVRGSRPVVLAAINRAGYCRVRGQTPDFPSVGADNRLLPAHGLAIPTTGIHKIQLTSRAPFVVTQVRVQRSQFPLTPDAIISLSS